MNSQKRLLWGLSAFIAIIVAGTAGYVVIEGWPFLDALYMTVITITTVGYAEVHPLSAGGQVFSIFLILGGVGGAIYALTGIVRYIVEGHFGTTLGRRRMKARIAKLKELFILCGYGKVGHEIARTFKEEGVPFVVIDSNPESIAQAEQEGYTYLEGNATSDGLLREAGIERARGLVSAVGTDADNIYVTLSARQLRPDLFIAARACCEEAETKLEGAGANRIVSPYSIGGRRMAMLALRPAVVDFVDTVVHDRGREYQLESINIGKDSPLVGQTLKAVSNRAGITVLATRKKSGKLLANPPAEGIIESGDRLIVIGTSKQLSALEEKFEEVKSS
ncbi:potassium channel family protein [Chloroflexota bacterium]